MEIRFNPPTESNGFQLFSQELETEPNVVFHGTTEQAFASIKTIGFKPTPELDSISFAKTSSVPLKYACEKRTKKDKGCVIAVRFPDISTKGIVDEGSVVYLYDHSIEPEIIAFCIIPESYQFI